MRRKNRQFKVTCDVPEEFVDDDDFAHALEDVMDDADWKVKVINEDGEKVACDVSKISYAGYEMEQE